jgi:O-phospho-L-seryl-tRNASec:L-selenocysteinyl-tRNA synthase
MLNNRKLPSTGWHDATIERLLNELALMDSNTFVSGTGVGEREGRLFSGLVARMHSRMAHGIGRSGDISASQPKAAGSSVLSQLCRLLTLDALHTAGLRDCSDCAVLPLATGTPRSSTI